MDEGVNRRVINKTMIPYNSIETLFLDVGNTLISMDFDWVAAEVGARGLPCAPDSLRRAEAAARPELSSRFFGDGHSTEGLDTFPITLRTILSRLEPAASMSSREMDSLVSGLVPVLRIPGQANRLWRSVMPGVPEALESLQALGLQLVVVSNSDGTVEQSLREAGLRPYFSVVVDSTLVGFAKPDRRIFEHALRESGAEHSRTLHVGDLYHADVRGARGAGLHVALLDPFDDWDVSDCERLRDVGALCERLQGCRG